jgi:hypothetical protein
MNTRILKVTNTNTLPPAVWHVPQYEIAPGIWLEFIGYIPQSPYLQPRGFLKYEEAVEFLKAPGIYRSGEMVPGLNGEVVTGPPVAAGPPPPAEANPHYLVPTAPPAPSPEATS